MRNTPHTAPEPPMKDPRPALLTVGEIARRTRAPVHRVEYILRTRDIAPASWAGNARVFAEDDLRFVAKELGLERPPEPGGFSQKTLFPEAD